MIKMNAPKLPVMQFMSYIHSQNTTLQPMLLRQDHGHHATNVLHPVYNRERSNHNHYTCIFTGKHEKLPSF